MKFLDSFFGKRRGLFFFSGKLKKGKIENYICWDDEDIQKEEEFLIVEKGELLQTEFICSLLSYDSFANDYIFNLERNRDFTLTLPAKAVAIKNGSLHEIAIMGSIQLESGKDPILLSVLISTPNKREAELVRNSQFVTVGIDYSCSLKVNAEDWVGGKDNYLIECYLPSRGGTGFTNSIPAERLTFLFFQARAEQEKLLPFDDATQLAKSVLTSTLSRYSFENRPKKRKEDFMGSLFEQAFSLFGKESQNLQDTIAAVSYGLKRLRTLEKEQLEETDGVDEEVRACYKDLCAARDSFTNLEFTSIVTNLPVAPEDALLFLQNLPQKLPHFRLIVLAGFYINKIRNDHNLLSTEKVPSWIQQATRKQVKKLSWFSLRNSLFEVVHEFPLFIFFHGSADELGRRAKRMLKKIRISKLKSHFFDGFAANLSLEFILNPKRKDVK